MKVFQCKRCGNNFTVEYKLAKDVTLMYCSKECRHPHQNKNTVRICAYCSLEFNPKYHISKNQDVQYCSKQCASKSKRCQYQNRYSLESAIKKLIIARNCYTSKLKIVELLSISSNTITQYSISIAKLNKECGFRKPNSAMELIIGEYLEDINVHFEEQKVFELLVGPKGGLLRYDFYLPDYNTLLELDDSNHWDTTARFYSDYKKECDDRKNAYAENKGIALFRVKYESVTKDMNRVKFEVLSILLSLGYLKDSENVQTVLNQQPDSKETL